MLSAPKFHFTIARQSDLLADIDIWEPALPGVFEKGHQHSYYEILIFLKGGGTHQMGAEVHAVADHSIHILTNNTFHELKRALDTDGFEIIFSEAFLHQLQLFDKKTNYVQYFSESRVLNLSEAAFSEFRLYFNELIRNKENRPIFYNLVSLILLKLISGEGSQAKNKGNAGFENAFMALLNRHYKEKKSSEFYSSSLNMSLNTFQRHVKSAFGKSVVELQNEKIIQEVKFQLSQTDKPIKEIAFDFNFSDESHFTHFFRNHIGISPSEYRKSALR